MKTLKITFALILFLIIGIITVAQINYEEAIRSARTAETDGEIREVLQEYGFQVDIYDPITPEEKVKALFMPLIKK